MDINVALGVICLGNDYENKQETVSIMGMGRDNTNDALMVSHPKYHNQINWDNLLSSQFLFF